jgi:hypothetical protein
MWAFFIGRRGEKGESVYLNSVWKEAKWERTWKKMSEGVDDSDFFAIFPSRQSPKRNWHGNRNAGLKDLERRLTEPH